MITVLFIFIVAGLASLTLTPVVRRLALHFDLTDKPSARKMHSGKIPRIGGVALFGSFFLPFLLLFIFSQYSPVTQEFFSDNRLSCFVTGATLIFLLGLLDDIRELSFLLKIFGQLLIAVFIYCCGFQITAVTTPFGADFAIGFLSLPLTIFWFLLVINAINFIDGLDGLAAGICLFVSLAMLFVCLVNGQLTSALAFAALAGALLGFLRYNFYPASIFMGDSGSYFLGYCLAILSIGGTIKGQVATALLIPVIALGVPLMDTLWTPLRRFMNGQSIFQADNKHIHHRLVRLGFTHRRAVLALYFLTVLLGIASMFLVHTQNQSAALIIFVLGIGFIGFLHYLSDSNLLSVENIASWARDLTDESGISLQRRLFFQHQRRISSASDPEQLWEAVCASLEVLGFDYAEFYCIEQDAAGTASTVKSPQRFQRTFSWRGVKQGKRAGASPALPHASVLRIELPLHQLKEDKEDEYAVHFGSLLLVKDMSHTSTEPYLLKRVEQLRRSMIAALEKFDGIRSDPLSSRSSEPSRP